MLKKFMEMFKKNNKGFTLVELMVVVVIIGALTAIAIPVYKNSQETAIQNAINANLKILDSAVAVYNTEHPNDQITDLGAPTAEDGSNVLVPDYIKKWPSGPNGVEYFIDDGSADYEDGDGDEEEPEV